MQGLAAATTCPSLPSLSPRIRSPLFRKTYATPRVHFSEFRWPAPLRLINSRSQRAQQEFGLASAIPSQHLSVTANQFLGCGLTPLRPNLLGGDRRSLKAARAYTNDFFRIKLPEIREKPEWWWRTLACIPYLIALQISDVGFYLQPLLENHETMGDVIYFIPGAIRRWPHWFFMVYCYVGYMWIVKNRELPHYLRFHMMMGMLLETGLQIVWCASNLFPLIHFTGRLGMYYWAGIGFAYICLVLECIRCALAGMYAHIPFVSDAAFVHTLFNLGGFQRPLR